MDKKHLKKYLKAIVKFMIQQPGNPDLKKTVELLGVDTMAELMNLAPGRHVYIPAMSTIKHNLAVLYIQQEFKSDEDFKTEEGKVKAENISRLFGIRKYRILKIWKHKKWVR